MLTTFSSPSQNEDSMIHLLNFAENCSGNFSAISAMAEGCDEMTFLECGCLTHGSLLLSTLKLRSLAVQIEAHDLYNAQRNLKKELDLDLSFKPILGRWSEWI